VDKAAFLVKAVEAPAEAGPDSFRTSSCPAALPDSRKRDPPTSPAERPERMSAKLSGFAQATRAPAPREPASSREQRRPLRGFTNAPGSGRRAGGGENAPIGSTAGAARAGWRRSTRRPTLGALTGAPRGLQPGKHRTAPSPRTVLRPVRRSGPSPETRCGFARTGPAFGQELPKAESEQLLGAGTTRRPALRPP
jgi:hypothetical protein